MKKKENENQSNKLRKNIKVFWETFTILIIALLYVFGILCQNHGYDFTEGMGGIVYLYVMFLLIVAFIFLIFNVIFGIKCIKNHDDSFNSNTILFLMLFIIIFYIVLWFVTLLDAGFLSSSNSEFDKSKYSNISSQNNKDNQVNSQRDASLDSKPMVKLIYKKDVISPKKITNDDIAYNDFIELINSDSILYRDSRDYGDFRICLTKDMKLLLFKVTNDNIIYNELSYYLNDINNPERRYDKGYYADYNNGGVPNIRIRIDKYNENQSERNSYMWYTYDSNGNLIEYSEYGYN